MEFSYNELFKSIPANQQQHFSHNVQPEVAAGYLFALQNQNKKKKKRATVSPEEINNNLNINDPAVAAELAMKKRRKGADPRKCYNDSCDRIVTKRNYCYKCQKRKERGLALNPKLPSIKQLLLPSDKKRARKNTSSIPEPLPTVNDINTIINNNHPQQPQESSSPTSSSSSSSSPSTFLPFNILPNIKEPSDKLPNYFETVLVNLMKERNERTPLPASNASSSSSSSSSSDPFLNNMEFSAQDKQQLHNLHQYLLQLSSGSEEKASTLLFQYISARNSQSPAPTHPLTPSHSSVDSFSFASSPSSNFPFGQSQMGFSNNQFSSPYSPYPNQSSNDPFNMFSPHNAYHPTSYGDHNVPVNHNQIKFGAQDMFLLPSPHSIRPNLFTTPDHINSTPANPYPNYNLNNNSNNNRMRFF